MRNLWSEISLSTAWLTNRLAKRERGLLRWPGLFGPDFFPFKGLLQDLVNVDSMNMRSLVRWPWLFRCLPAA